MSDRRRTYRNRGFSRAMAVYGLVFLALGLGQAIATARFYPEEDLSQPFRILLLFGGIVPACLLFRRSRCGVRIDSATVWIRNPWRTYRIPRREVERFSLGPWMLLPEMGLVHLTDGRTMSAHGIVGLNRALFPRSTAADDLVVEMNRDLARRQREDTAGTNG